MNSGIKKKTRLHFKCASQAHHCSEKKATLSVRVNFFLVNVQVLRKAIQLCNLFNACREKHIKLHVFWGKNFLKWGKEKFGGRRRHTLKFPNLPCTPWASPPGLKTQLPVGTLRTVPPRLWRGALLTAGSRKHRLYRL